jgi:prepilin-type N-terminal cleavage/methylation domain-containing protein
MRHARPQSGYTLMEVLVVLTITGLVSGVLLQALSQVYRMQERFGVQIERSQVGVVEIDWYRQVVQQLQADYVGGPGRLRGDAREFEALGLNPFAREQDLPRGMKLSLRTEAGRTELWLRSGDKDVALAQWPELTHSEFVYLDANAERHAQWPPPLGNWPALPSAIWLRLQQGDQQTWIVASPRSTFQPVKPIGVLGALP